MIRRLFKNVRSIALVSLVSAASIFSHAATQAAPQITGAVNASQRFVLKGNVHPLLRKARDLGVVPASTPSGRMLLVLKRPAAQDAALKQFLGDVHTPGSPSYHKWLTPAQFGEQFGPADSDIQAITGWLQSQGLVVAHVSAGRTAIEFSGTTGQLQAAFRTSIHQYSIHGETHLANSTDPQIPAALAPAVAGISSMNDFRPRPMHTVPAPHPAQLAAKGSHPAVTIPNGGGYYVGPGDAATIYNTPNQSLNIHYGASQNLDGTGVTIAIAGVSNIDTTDVDNYRSVFGLPANTPQVIVDGNDPGLVDGADVEALLDTEVSGALAPAATVKLYVAADTTLQAGLYLAIQRALDDNTATILNVSFGLCEANFGTAGNQEVANFWQQAAAQGISVTVSTGDSGSAGCDDQNTETSAQLGLQVNGLASTPYNIAVGGTDFNLTSTNASQYWSDANGGGLESALGYIPEIPWNDSTSTIGPLSGNIAFADPNNNNQTNIAAASGGASGCLTPLFDNAGNFIGCSGAYAKPAWQQGLSTQDATRDIPDVSLFSSDGFHNASWFTCISGTSNGAPFTDCLPDAQGNFTFHGVGGTSASAPAMAGILALVNQKFGAQGQADYVLYPLAAQFPAAFHDTKLGNISVVCAAGSLNCGQNNFLSGYDTSAGYDLATGLGSMDVTQLINNWNAITFKTSSTALQLNGSTAPLTITHGTPVTVNVAVTSTAGTPSGNVAIVNNNSTAGTSLAPVDGTTPSPSVLTLANGLASTSYANFPGGSYSVFANYGGDGSFASSKSNPIPITVTPENSILALFVDQFDSSGAGQSVAGMTLPYGTYISADARPLGVSQQNLSNPSIATGTVTFTGATATPQTAAIASNGYAELPGQAAYYYPPGSYSVSASYSGDASLNPAATSTPASVVFAIAKAGTAVSATPANNPPVGSVAYTAVVVPNPASFATAPTGVVTVTNGSTPVGSPFGVSAAQDSQTGASLGVANIVISNSALPSGAALTLTYSGDGNYTGSSGAIQSAYTLAVAPGTLTIANSGSSNNSATSKVTITPQSGFTGNVALSCAVTGPSGVQSPPTCALDKSSITVGSGAVSANLTVSATPPNNATMHSPLQNLEKHWYAGGGAALACVLLFGIPGRRRSWQRMLGMLVFVVAAGMAGCGGGGGGGSNNPGTTPGSYTVTVTAASGSVTQTASVAVTVQ